MVVSDNFSKSLQFKIEAPPRILTNNHIYNQFPPNGSLGDYYEYLPFVVFERSTLPWELRHFSQPTIQENRIGLLPWLALVILEDDDELDSKIVNQVRKVKIREYDIIIDEEGNKQKVYNHIVPKEDELSRMVHVMKRQDDEKERAVLVANRLPRPNTNYTAHVIALDKKEEYYKALAQADAGNQEEFIIYIGTQLLESLSFYLRSAKGQNLEVEMDIDKEIDTFKASLSKIEDSAWLSVEIAQTAFENVIAPLTQLIRNLCALVTNDLAIREHMPCISNPFHQDIARAIFAQRARVRNRENSNPNGDEVFIQIKAHRVSLNLVFSSSKSIQASRFLAGFRRRFEGWCIGRTGSPIASPHFPRRLLTPRLPSTAWHARLPMTIRKSGLAKATWRSKKGRIISRS